MGCVPTQRLEFLGDSVLSVVTSEFLFDFFSDHPEGDLTKLRADIVCTRSLAGFAKSVGLGDYLYLGNGQEALNGRRQDKLLEDAFEALVAAIYLDSGKDLDRVKDFLLPFIRREVEKIYRNARLSIRNPICRKSCRRRAVCWNTRSCREKPVLTTISGMSAR